MEFFKTIADMLMTAVRGIWPGVAAAIVGGYFGWSMLGMPGFLVGAAVGAFAGAWGGHQFGLAPIKPVSGIAKNDLAIYAGSAFLFVVVGYFLLQFAMVVATIVAIGGIVLFWLSN